MAAESLLQLKGCGLGYHPVQADPQPWSLLNEHEMTDENPQTRTSGPLFLRISIARLIVLSILSCGINEAYWIYEHWAHIKRRDRIKISPFGDPQERPDSGVLWVVFRSRDVLGTRVGNLGISI